MNEKKYPWPVEYFKNTSMFYPWHMEESVYWTLRIDLTENEIKKAPNTKYPVARMFEFDAIPWPKDKQPIKEGTE